MQRPHWDLIILHKDTAKDTFFFLKTSKMALANIRAMSLHAL
jgi:hypothetical protein